MTTDIVSTREIADRLGVKPETVHMWRWRDLGFPEPTWQLAVGPIWDWPKVEAWAHLTGRGKGKPRRSKGAVREGGG